MQNQETSGVNTTWSIELRSINGPEDLRETARGTDVEIVQLKPEKLQGSITRFGIGNLEMNVGCFDSAIRIRGLLSHEKVVLGTILASDGPISHWWKDVRSGDVGLIPAGVDIDGIYGGGGTYLRVFIALPELIAMLGGEHILADPEFWNTKHVCRTDPLIGDKMPQRLMGIMSDVKRKITAPSAQAANFLQRSIIEAFVSSLLSTDRTEREQSRYTGARLVSEVEDYVGAAGERPVHISELCGALRVSRRSLHRAFEDTLGTGPLTYLRRRRLSAIRSVLKRSDPTKISIGDVAFEYGFPESGRFAAYYRAHFGETPLETCRSWSASRQVRPQSSAQ